MFLDLKWQVVACWFLGIMFEEKGGGGKGDIFR